MADLQRLCLELGERDLHLPLLFEHSPDLTETICALELLTGDRLPKLVDTVAHNMKSDIRAAAASLFQKWYVGLLIPSVLAPLTTAGIGVLADAASTEVVLEDGLPAQIRLLPSCRIVVLPERLERFLPGATARLGLDACETVADEETLRQLVFDTLFEGHLLPFLYHMASVIPVSPKVLWGNVANYSAYLYDEELVRFAELQEQVLRDREAVLSTSAYKAPLGDMFHNETLDELDPPRCVRVRHVCCMRNQFPGLENKSCLTCPRLTREERVARYSQSAKALQK
jgi:ferric iron reductase protein FhuF